MYDLNFGLYSRPRNGSIDVHAISTKILLAEQLTMFHLDGRQNGLKMLLDAVAFFGFIINNQP